jgi:hypothetical protein
MPNFNATAARAARREALGEAWTFDLDGETFALPTELTRTAARQLRQLEDHDVDGLLCLLMGEEQYARFAKREVTMQDIADILEAYVKETGLGMGAEEEAGASATPAARDWENKLKAESERRYGAELERDGAYRERAHLVALLAAMTDGAVITYATDVDEPGWQIVYLTFGGRQASWHISPRDADLFAHVERVEHDDPRGHWDGHTTEEKYEGIAAWTAYLTRRCGPACAEQHTERGRCEIERNR